MKKLLYPLLLFFLLSFQAEGQVQIQQQLDSLDLFDRTHLEVLPDQGWIISANAQPGNFVTLRFNDCGELQWAKRWRIGTPNTLFIRDMIISSQGHIAITGHSGFFEMADPFFLLLNAEGEVITFQLYYSFPIEYVYSISETANGQFLIYGNQTNLTTIGRNFFLKIDQEGEIIWSKGYFEQQIWGAGIGTQDGGALARSGNLIYKIDSLGALEWANSYPEIHASSKPVEVEDGYVFNRMMYGSDHINFLYKIGLDGTIDWITDNFNSYTFPEIIERSNGQLIALSTRTTASPNLALSLIEITADGQLLEQRAIHAEKGEAIALFDDGSIIVSGYNQGKLFFLKSDAERQFSCSPAVSYEQFSDALSIQTSPASTDIVDLTFELLDSTLYQEDIDILSAPTCIELAIEFPHFGPDTTICQGDSIWLDANLEGASYLWQDGSTEPWFLVNESGNYEVEITKCGQSIVRDISIDVELCPCQFQMPTIFTPNSDGLNDTFQLMARCDFIADYRLQLFDRWGEEVFISFEPNQGWDGNFNGYPMPADTYVYLLEYTYDEGTGLQTVKEQGSFVLVR